MKTLLAILLLGGIAYFWHRGETAKATLELETVRGELNRAREALATTTQALEASQAELHTATDANRTLSESLAAATTELNSLRTQHNAPPTQPSPVPAPAEIRFDSSPMTSFSFEGTRLIEARITTVDATGVTVTGKDGRSVVVDLDRAQKTPDLRIRARDAIQAAMTGR